MFWLLLGGGGAVLLIGVIVLLIVLTRKSGSGDPNIPDVDLGGRWPQPMLRFGPPDETSVTFRVANIVNEYTRQAVSEGIGKLIDGGHGPSWSVGASEGTRMTVVVRPILDPEGCSKRVDFGEVRGVVGREITVVARKVEGPPADADALTKAVFHINMKYKKFRQQGVRELKDIPPDDKNRPGVVKALEQFLAKETDLFQKADAVTVFAKWATKDQVPLLLRLLNDNNRHLQNQVLHALARVGGEAAIDPIAARLESHWPDAGNALKAMGAPAEKALLKCMDSPSQRTRELACDILKDIATKESVPAMIKALDNPSTRRNALLVLERLKAPEAADALAKLLDDFGNRGEVIRLLKALGPAAEPALIRTMDSLNQQAREGACEILKDAGTKACVPAMAKALSDMGMRRNALAALQRLKAIEAAPAIARGLDEFFARGDAVRVLKQFGPGAEKAVIPYLASKDLQTFRAACEVLAEIGTGLSIPYLVEGAGADGGRQGPARDALKRIKFRGK
jgi:HEAT repeat protein